jgi:imidazole glycerol-phosphate synthase subunit HisF
MQGIRVIPCLLLRGAGLVKTRQFKDPKYVGDPINAIKIFNDKECDELMLLDITATQEQRGPSFSIIEEVASECFMPLAYGGGVRTVDEMRRVLKLGVEKVVLNSTALKAPDVVRDASREFGAQAVVASIDVRKRLFGGYEVYAERATRATGIGPVECAKRMEDLGAGEIVLNAVDRDGTMKGYDLELLRKVTDAVSVPVVAVGGAGCVEDFGRAIGKGGASAVSAGAMFVFHGPHRAVLITYPDRAELARGLHKGGL